MKINLNQITAIFFSAVFVWAIFSAFSSTQTEKTGLADSQIDTLQDIQKSIDNLYNSNINDDDTNWQIGKKYIEYDLILAQFNGVKPGNQPYLLEGSRDKGVLLIHGFSASPHEVRELAEYLNKKGNLTVYVPVLAGHGADPANFGAYTWEDWYNSLDNGYNALSLMTDKLYVGGVSLGGDLAIEMSKHKEVDGVFSIGAPIYLRNSFVRIAFILKYFVPTMPNNNILEEDKPYYYYNRSVAAIAQLVEFIDHFKKDLNKVDKPIFIMQATNDLTIEPLSAEYIYSNIASEDKLMKNYPGESHIIINKYAKKNVFRDLYDFITKTDNSTSH